MDKITKVWSDNPARAVITHFSGAAVKPQVFLLGWGAELQCVSFRLLKPMLLLHILPPLTLMLIWYGSVH